MKRFLTKAVTALENTPLTLGSFALAFAALIIVRLTIENALGLFPGQTLFFLFFELGHTFLFFLCSFLILLPITRYAGGVGYKQATGVLLFGFLIIWTPPIIDTWMFKGGAFWSFYEFDGLIGLIKRYFTLFGDTPEIGITYGVRVEVVLVTLALGLYAWVKSGRYKRAFATMFLAYTTLFVLGTFPAWLTLGLLFFEKSLLAISAADVAALFLTPETIFARELSDFRSVLNAKMSLVYAAFAILLTAGFLWKEERSTFLALWQNARLPQLVYHGGLLFVGMALALHFTEGTIALDFFHFTGAFVLLAAVHSAWLASVVINDRSDTAIDRLTNPDRPLIVHSIPTETYTIIGILFFAASLFLAGIVSFTALFCLLCYQALAFIYSAPPYRLKRFPIIATLLAALAGLLILVAGFLTVVPVHSLEALPLPLIFFLFFALLSSIPLKDFKDIQGDKGDRVYTIPVLLGEQRAKHLLGSLIFLSFALSPIILHEPGLFFPALLFGAAAFYTVERGTALETDTFAYRKIPKLILGIVTLYGFVLAFLITH